MDKKRAFTILAVGLILMACAGHLMAQSTLDTALTYQGFLKRNGSPVNRMMDLRFTLFADPNATPPIGAQLEVIGVDVIDGHFALELDFGAAPFTGEPRWLQTELRRNDVANDPYIPQTPLLRFTLSPYAIYAGRAGYVQDGITGRGTAGSIPRFSDPNTIGDSVIFQNAGNVGIGTQTPNERLSVDGVIESTGGIRFPDNSLQTSACTPDGNVPPGGIIMWSGLIDNIPNGWLLCDGTNETPDLRNRFVVGASQDNGGVAMTNVKGNLMQAGGEHQHTLTTAEMPVHRHSHTRFGSTGDSGEGKGSDHCKGTTTLFTDYAGGSQPHENCPPFYALAYIMRSLP